MTHQPDLIAHIKSKVGENITFWNGCQISLYEDNGAFIGTSPYGQEWSCSLDNYAESIARWVEYWDNSRDETGGLLINTI